MNWRIGSTFVLLLIVLFAIPAIATECVGAFEQRGLTLIVSPTGIDDTNNLQCAFTAATGKPGLTVQLAKGNYITGPLIISNFQGKFRGAGIGQTIIRNPNWPVYVMSDIGCNEWGRDCLPIAPTPGNPFPSMFTFLNGDFEVSDLSVQVVGKEPTTGWSIVGVEVKGFQMVFAVDGQPGNGAKAVNATFRRVEVIGEPSDQYFTYNVWMPIAFCGWFNYEPVAGSLLVTDSKFKGTGTSTTVQNVSDARVVITHNTYENTFYGPDVSDLKDTIYTFAQNKVSGAVIGAMSGASGCDLLLGNCGIVNSKLMFTGNSFEGAIGMLIDGPMDANSSCQIVGNTLVAPDPDLSFGASTQNCTAVIALNDTYVDLGTFNQVQRSGRSPK